MCDNLKMRSRKGMEKMIWLVIAIVIMFVMVAILASFFQSGVKKMLTSVAFSKPIGKYILSYT